MARSEDISAGGSRRGKSLFLRQWGFSWGEIAASVALHGTEMLPPAAELLAPPDTYYADHLSASRHILTLLWSHTRRGLPGGFLDPDRILEPRLYDAMARLTSVEAAIMQAECLRVRPLHADRETAGALVDRHLKLLQDAADGVGGAAELLHDVVEEVGDTPTSRDGATATDKEREPAVSLAEDALRQLRLLLKTIQDIVEALVPRKKRDDIAALIQNLARLIASGTEAAIAGAIAALVEAVDSDASAKDIICVPGPNGEVTIWFRVRKGCLVVLDWLVSDDYVYIHKTAKGATPTFATGKSAEAIKKKVQEKLEKELEGGGGTGAAPTPPAPKPEAPPPPAPLPPPAPPAPPAKPGAGKAYF